MTRTSGSRSDSAFPTDRDIDALRKRLIRHEQILEGALPGNSELLTGLPLCRGDLQSDVMIHLDKWKSERGADIDADLLSAAEFARAEVTLGTLGTLQERAAAALDWQNVELVERCDIWLAYVGDLEARARVLYRALDVPELYRNSVDPAYRLLFAVGLPSRGTNDEYDPAGSDTVLEAGVARLSRLMPALQSIITDKRQAVARATGVGKLAAGRQPSDDWDIDEGDDALALDSLLDDRKEDEDDEHGLVVVPTMPVGTGGQREIRKSWQGLAGRALPRFFRGDIGQHRRELVGRWPHAVEIIDTVLSDLAATTWVRFRPTLIVGNPGSGKSSLARAICEQVGIPVELTSVAGSTDSSAMGTSAQWSTARESTPLQLIRRTGVATIGMIWDEIEKASTGRHNGSVLDAILPMLENDQAARFRDPALEVEVNLSLVSHFATANSIDGLPAPVRDRFRVLYMPEPTWQHIGPLARQIVGRIAQERGVDARWFSPLAEDELDLVKDAWPGGSIRKLTAIVRTIVDGRDQIMGRC